MSPRRGRPVRRCSEISVGVEQQPTADEGSPGPGAAGVCESRIVAGLDHIRWLGGGTGAGKTTVAQQIAQRTGVSIYSTDATIRAHGSMLGAAEALPGAFSPNEHG